MVAWLTMAAVRRELIDCGHLHKDTPHLSDFLPAVALGTTADCVSFATSRNNRIVVQRGLHLINRNPAPCWEALREIRQVHGPITSATLSYIFAVMVNAAGRLDEAMTGVKLLRSATIEQARGYAAELLEANEERKQISAEMLVVAMDQATRMVAEGAVGLAIWLPNGHSGVHGISASRVTEAYGRPTLCISPKLGQPGVVTGSARTIPGFHVRNAFAYIKERMPNPDDILASGGHAMAGGITLNESAIPAFRDLWNESVLASGVVIGPVILTDGELPVAPSFSLLSEVSALEPFGKDFDAPLFSQRSIVRSARAVGEGGKHVKLSLEVQGRVIDGIWFNTPELSWRLEPGVPVNAVFELGSNTFRGNTTMQALVRHLALEATK